MASDRDIDNQGPTPDEPARRRFLKTAVASASAVGAAATPLAGLALDADPKAKTQTSGIPTRAFGNTGLQVPILHLGTAQRLDPRYDKLMHRSFAAGVTWFDTALAYGRGSSHRAIANFLTQIDDRKQLC
jgi:hypothetical protein